MTAVQRGSGPRSMGASLLDQVLAETLDPAYAQAAEARRAREQAAASVTGHPAAGSAPSSSPARRRSWAPALVALVMVLAGGLLAVTYDEAAAGARGREQVREALLSDIERGSEVTDALAAELERLRAEVTRTRADVLAATAVGQEALDRLARAAQGAGAVPVAGPGLRVTLANAEAEADTDPVGGTTEEDPRGRVRDGDLQLVVNALWAAGAEAISINGERLGPTSAIRFAGEAVLVDFRPVTHPYEVSAVGDPDTLTDEFLASPEVGSLAVISESFGLRFEFAEEDELSVPAASTPELRSALAVPPGAAPDPSPGG